MWIGLLLACRPVPDPGTAPGTGPPPVPTPTDTGAAPTPVRQWVEISPAPCARDSEGWVECWSTPNWASPLAGSVPAPTDFPIPPSPVPMAMFHAYSSSAVWGIEQNTGRTRVWFCGTNGPEGLVGSHPPSQCSPPQFDDPVQIGYMSGLESTGVIRYVESYAQLDGVQVAQAQLDSIPVVLTLDDRLVVRWFENTPLDVSLPRASEVTGIAQANGGACVLYEDATIDCFGAVAGWNPPETLFNSPPYRDLQGGGLSICATRADWTIECNDGTVLNDGPYRDLAVGTYRVHIYGDPAWDNGLGLCLITEDNAIRCHGPRYDYEDLQEKLPKGDAAP